VPTDVQTRRENARLWQARYRRALAEGTYQPPTDAEPARALVREWMATGMSVRVIAARCHVDYGVIRRLVWGSDGYPPTKRLPAETMDKIMSFRPALDDYPDSAVISTVGSRRRLQALATRGWTPTAAAHATGNSVSERRFRHAMTGSKTTARMARTIRDAFNALWDKTPTEEQVPAHLAELTRQQAAEKEWAGPLAWDDATIDYPEARPRRGLRSRGGVDMSAVIRSLEGETAVIAALTGPERVAAVERGVRIRDMYLDDIADILGMPLATVGRYWERAKERARERGETWPDEPRWTTDRLNRPHRRKTDDQADRAA
jgi:DNA-directed RNA polymerase specialized sigma24 family protein